ncbi:Potassium transporter [Aspergillus melleus]|uniref:Potassium transporter n=1 Tax=Aspergillus melleus TaxID=138277 RepID=A0ACC3B7H7_9EURO|nr:Potassium transporter [Aspergillus melleus]
MPCCGDREKGATVSLEEKWDYVNLSDFKSESCLSPFSYFFLWVFLVVSLAVYGVDTFTAVNLLAFSRWAGQIEPAIPFTVSRWIFAVCIIISFVLLVLRWLKAIRAIRSGSIAQSYLDSLAVRIQSIRMGKEGRGWKRFLVFAELTKSKKGAEYVALFAYFSFETWMNTIFADGPRQVVNAITLYSVMKMDLLPGGENASSDSDSPAFFQFFDNVKILAEHNNLRAVVLFGMLFTLIIWVLSILKLALAIILYLIFLFHHIPSEDGSLKAYCRRKINSRLTRIVRQKVDKALSKGIALQNRAPTRPNLTLDTKPTLPAVGAGNDDKGPIVTTISRSTTQTTLPPYSSRPGTAAPDRNPTLPDVATFDEKPPLSRTMTQSSAYSDAASMSGSTAVSGYSPLDRQTTPAPPVPPLPSEIPMPVQRSQTPMSRPTYTPAPPPSVRGPNRMTPANGFRDQGNDYASFSLYDQTSAPCHSFSPVDDSYARSFTPATTFSPNNHGPIRPYPPPSVGATPHPHPQTGYLPRSFTPASYTANRPPQNFTPVEDLPMRPFPPAGPSGPSRSMQSQGPDGYGPFNPPARNSPVSATGTPAPNALVYPPHASSRTFSPSSDYSGGPAPPVRAYTPHDTYGPQSQQPHHQDFF